MSDFESDGFGRLWLQNVWTWDLVALGLGDDYGIVGEGWGKMAKISYKWWKNTLWILNSLSKIFEITSKIFRTTSKVV